MPTPQENLVFVEQASCLFLKMVFFGQFPPHHSSQGQPQQESSATPQFTARGKATTVRAGDGLGDRQSQSRSAGMARSIAIDSVEAIENALLLDRPNPNTSILNLNYRLGVSAI